MEYRQYQNASGPIKFTYTLQHSQLSNKITAFLDLISFCHSWWIIHGNLIWIELLDALGGGLLLTSSNCWLQQILDFLVICHQYISAIWLWMLDHGNKPLYSWGRIQHYHCVKSAAEVIRVFEWGIIRCKALGACCVILNTCISASLSTDSMHTLSAGWASVSRGDRKSFAKTEFQGSTIGCIHCQEWGSLWYNTTTLLVCKSTMYVRKYFSGIKRRPQKRGDFCCSFLL